MNQDDILLVLSSGPMTPTEILERLEPGNPGERNITRLQSVQEKLRALRKWDLVEVIGSKDEGCSHSKVWALKNKEAPE